MADYPSLYWAEESQKSRLKREEKRLSASVPARCRQKGFRAGDLKDTG